MEREPRLPLIVSFSGIDGAGKSTQIDKLCARLSQAGLVCKQLTFWDDVAPLARWRSHLSHKFLDHPECVRNSDTPADRNDKNVRTWYLSFVRAALYLMDALFLRRKVKATVKSNADVIIFDRYIFDQLAVLPFEHLAARIWISLVLAIVPGPDVAYLLDADPEAACARKPEYPVNFVRKYRSAYLQLLPLARLTLIPPLTVDEVHHAIMRKFERVCGVRVVGPPGGQVALSTEPAPSLRLSTG